MALCATTAVVLDVTLTGRLSGDDNAGASDEVMSVVAVVVLGELPVCVDDAVTAAADVVAVALEDLLDVVVVGCEVFKDVLILAVVVVVASVVLATVVLVAVVVETV